MTYFGFLAFFLLIPLLLLGLLHILDRRRGRMLPLSMQYAPPLAALFILVVLAVVYTTPWDNYLVATRVWWYDPELVTGLVLGWVPIEEYTFFVLQTLFTGLWTIFLARRIGNSLIPDETDRDSGGLVRLGSVCVGGLLWIGSVWLLIGNWKPGTYLGLELAWALPPILLQLSFGADLLWRHRKLVLWSLLPTTIYLCICDAIAINSGTWTIDPQQSTGILIGNLPIEEILFFLVTNMLVVFGLTLFLEQTTHQRLPLKVQLWFQNLIGQKAASTSSTPINSAKM